MVRLLGVNTYIKEYFTSSTDGLKTSINVNAGWYGKTILVLFSDHYDSGNSTTSAIYMLRCGYSGNHLTTVEVVKNSGGANIYPTFSIDESGNINTNIRGYYLFIVNR